MLYSLLMSLFSYSLDLMAILGMAKSDKNLDIILLVQQIRILQRKVKTPPHGYPIPREWYWPSSPIS
jgi:hypothetical protein